MSCSLIGSEGRPAAFAATALASALLACLAAHAPARASKPEVVITIFVDHYVLAGRAVDDLDLLEKAVGSLRPRAVRLDACGRGAEHPQRAAAHRFRNLSLELRFLEADAPLCRAGVDLRAQPAGGRRGRRPFNINYEAVDQWWHESMP